MGFPKTIIRHTVLVVVLRWAGRGWLAGCCCPLGVAHLVLEEVSRQMGQMGAPSPPLACTHTVSPLAQTLFLFELGPCHSS